jgi:4-amino-4-deoxy-L-arabinose transferase-like glycosyltransferase
VTDRWIYLGLAAWLTILWLATLTSRPLFNPDEGRYAEIPREMAQGGDWVIPHLNGLAYAEKPPLQYWATALSYRVFGFTEFSARLYSSLCALGTIVTVWLTARRLSSPQGGIRAAAIIGSMLMFVALGQLLTLDMSLSFYMTVSLAAFLLAQASVRPEPLMLLAWAAAALGVLTKGLIAAAVPAAVLILYSLYTRDFGPWRRLCLRWGMPLFLAIAVPWHVLAARRVPDFLQFYFVHEHFARYLTPVSDRQQPWWFFSGVFLAGTVPWTLPALRVLASGWRRAAAAGGGAAVGAGSVTVGLSRSGEFQPVLFLWIWIVFIGVFFSLSDSKLMPYILPAIPALALSIAALPAPSLERDIQFTAMLTVLAGVGLGVASLNWPRVVASSDRSAYFLPLAKPVGQIALLLAVSGAFVLVRRAPDAARAGTRAAVFLGVGWCLSWLLLIRAAALVSTIYSGVDLAAAIPAADRDAPLYSVGTYDQSLPFYLRRTVTLVAYRGELDFGLRHAPGAEISDVAEFVHLWSQQSRAFAVMENTMFDDLTSRGVPMRVVARNVNHILVARQ